MQHMIGVGLHPAVACDPCVPVRLNLLIDGPKMLQRGDTLLRFLRPEQERDAREPGGDVEVIHTRTRAADERARGDGGRERFERERLDGDPEVGRRCKISLLVSFRREAVEHGVDAAERYDLRIVE